MEKATLSFRIYKIWQILMRYAGTFCRAQTLKLGGVACFFFCAKGLTSLKGTYRYYGLLLKSTIFSSDIFEFLIKLEFQIQLSCICQGDKVRYRNKDLFRYF